MPVRSGKSLNNQRGAKTKWTIVSFGFRLPEVPSSALCVVGPCGPDFAGLSSQARRRRREENMPRHEVIFDGDICRAPPGVESDIWQLELPSILGLAYGPCRDADDSPVGYSLVESASDSQREGEEAEESSKERDVGLRPEAAEFLTEEYATDEIAMVVTVRSDSSQMDASPNSDYALTEIDAGASDEQLETSDEEEIAEERPPGNREDASRAAHVTVEVPYSLPHEELIEQWNVPEDYVNILAVPAISMEEPPEHPLELFAFRMLHRGSMNVAAFQDLLQILLQHLQQLTKARKRKCVEFASTPQGGSSFTLIWGSYVTGGLCGMTRNTKVFPWMARLLVALVRGHRSQHVFSSLGLHLNTYMAPHLDKHNHPALPSYIIPRGRWQGGGLWVVSLPQQSANGDMMGRVYTLGDQGVIFRSHWLHGTMAWKGQRLVLVAYANNNISNLSPEDTAQLDALGFNGHY